MCRFYRRKKERKSSSHHVPCCQTCSSPFLKNCKLWMNRVIFYMISSNVNFIHSPSIKKTMSTPFSISFPEILSLYLNDIPLLSFLVSMNVSRTTSRPRSTWGEKLANMDFFFIFPFCCLQQTDTQRVTSPTRTS